MNTMPTIKSYAHTHTHTQLPFLCSREKHYKNVQESHQNFAVVVAQCNKKVLGTVFEVHRSNSSVKTSKLLYFSGHLALTVKCAIISILYFVRENACTGVVIW